MTIIIRWFIAVMIHGKISTIEVINWQLLQMLLQLMDQLALSFKGNASVELLRIITITATFLWLQLNQLQRGSQTVDKCER